MNYCYRSWFAVLLSGICTISLSASAAIRISLKKAMTSKVVTVVATSAGGYTDKCLTLNITNNSPSELNLDIDPALIFTPDDTSYQHLVVLGSESLALSPGQSKKIGLSAYCGKSYARCPAPDLSYHFWRQGDSNMIKTLIYVKQNNVEQSLAQRAVWTFTNGYCLNSIYFSGQPGPSERFAQYVASLRKVKLPDYFTEYQIDNTVGRPVLASGNAKTYVNMHWPQEGYNHMYLTIYKANGDVYKRIEADQIIDKYGITVKVEFDPVRDPKGTYFVELRDDTRKVWDQKKVIVGMRDCDML